MQTNEYDHRFRMHPIISAHHKTPPAFPGYLWNQEHMVVQPHQAPSHANYHKSMEGHYFKFDDDNKMSYEYTLHDGNGRKAHA